MDEKLAKLCLRYVGTKRKKPYDYLTMAEGIKYCLDHLYERSIEKVAKEGKVSSKQIQDFLNLLELPLKVKKLIRERKIGINTASRLTSRRLLPVEQERLADAVVEHKLGWREVMEIVRFKGQNPKLTIDDCIQSILRSRPVVEKHHVIVTEIKQLQNRKLESLERSGTSLVEVLVGIIKKKLRDPASFVSLKIRGSLIFLELQEDAYLVITEEAKKLGRDAGGLVEKIVGDGLRDLQ